MIENLLAFTARYNHFQGSLLDNTGELTHISKGGGGCSTLFSFLHFFPEMTSDIVFPSFPLIIARKKKYTGVGLG